MDKKLTLVILAAGIGSRYGGLKQLDSLTPNGEAIIDFSIYDAIKVGFSKVVFVIRKSINDEFREAFDAKLNGEIEVEYVFQETDLIPKEFLPTNRKKPWGTAHALLTANEAVTENFCVINADDFYGRAAFEAMCAFLNKTNSDSTEFAMVGFRLKNTLSENGSVSRGQCFLAENNELEKIVERTNIFRKNDRIVYVEEDGSETSIDPKTIVSMNFWGFTPQIFDHLESDFHSFLKTNSDKPKAEFFIPSVVDKLIAERQAIVSVLRSDSKWLGITYKEDKEQAASRIKTLQKQEIYPSKLW